MSDLRNALNTIVSQDDWDLMSGHAGIAADKLKEQIISALEVNVSGGPQTTSLSPVTFTVPSSKQAGPCETQDFEISLFKLIGVRGSLTLCGSGSSNWTAELKLCIILAGASVWCTTYKFDPQNLGVCFDINVGLANVNLCIKLMVSPKRVCLNLSGRACIWAFGWQCENFDTTPFCIPLP